MSDIYVSQPADLSDIIGDRHNLEEIHMYLNENDVVILPEYYGTQMSFSMDLVNLIKDLREKGIKVGIVDDGSGIRESKFEDILIQLGIFGAKAAIGVILKIVGQHIYDNYVKDREGKLPHTKVTSIETIRKNWRNMNELQKRLQMLSGILRMTLIDDSVFNYLMLARIAAKESKIQDAENNYIEGLSLLEQQRQTESTEDVNIGCLTMKAEYLSFQVPRVIEAGEISKARGLVMDALNLIHNAILINTKQDRSRLLSLHEKKLLRLTISNFGCLFPKNKMHYTIKCPIRIRSFLGANATSTTVIRRDCICSICGRTFILCDHKVGYKYGDKMAKIISRPGELLDVSLVSAPKDPLGRDITLHIPRLAFDKDFSQEDLKKIEQEGTYCHYCPANNRQVDELTYDKFVNMQKSSHKQSSNLSPDDIYITTFLGNEGDFDFSTIIDKPLVKFTSDDRYVHLPTPAFHWKKSDPNDKIYDNTELEH